MMAVYLELKLIRLAKAGADAVKFQHFKAETILAILVLEI